MQNNHIKSSKILLHLQFTKNNLSIHSLNNNPIHFSNSQIVFNYLRAFKTISFYCNYKILCNVFFLPFKIKHISYNIR